MFLRAKPDLLSAFLAVLLLTGCDDEDEGSEGVPIDETDAAIEAPALAPNRLVEDPPDAPESLEPAN